MGVIQNAVRLSLLEDYEERGTAALPEWIGGGENLVGLFQPSSATRSYHRLLMSGLGRTGAGKWLRVGAAALRSFPLAAVLGLAPGVPASAVVKATNVIVEREP